MVQYNSFLRRIKEYQKHGEILEEYQYKVKVKWDDGTVDLVNRIDLDIPLKPITEYKVICIDTFKVLEHWKKVDGVWTLQEPEKPKETTTQPLEIAKPLSNKEKWLLMQSKK